MKLLHELATGLLAGSAHRPPALPPLSGPLGDLLGAVAAPDTELEIRLLRAAGALAVCADAGFVPSAAGDDLPAACPPEALPAATEPALAAVLGRIVADGPDPLRREAWQRLAARGVILPPGVLPRVLALAAATPALRAALGPVLGRRGVWLARLNPAWFPLLAGRDAAADLPRWEEGSLDERRQILASLRSTAPGRAQNLLEADFGGLDARERAGLLEEFGRGLSLADEDFLQGRLADRSREVRLLAARLLAHLPASGFGARMAERLAACLGHERKLLRQVLTLEAPEAFGADWKADALEEARPRGESLGERAWWLYQLARAVPLAWWEAHAGMTPAELLKWGARTDWSEALLRAWRERLQQEPAAAWAAAFLATPAAKVQKADLFPLIACLPLAEREAHWLRLLEAGPRRIARGDLLGRIVQGLAPDGSEALSADFSRRVLREVRAGLADDGSKWDYALRSSLPEFVCLIPPDCFLDATAGWPAGLPESSYFSETLARVLVIVEQRKTLHRTLS